MPAEYANRSPLEPHLYEEWDDEDDLRAKAPLAAFLAGTQTPSEVAQAIDTYVRTETSTRLQKLTDYAACHTLGPEDYESGEWIELHPPNAGAFAQEFIQSWCRISTAFCPHSDEQDRLMMILDELRRLPRWMAPESRPDENGEVLRSEFWAFGHDWLGLEDEFRRQKEDGEPLTHLAESCDRWVNLQSTMARVTAQGLIYCAPFTALERLPSADQPAAKVPDVDIEGAAQWVMWPLECRYVYHECLKKDVTSHYWEPWSKQRWATWKQLFESAAGNLEHNDRIRSLASQALQEMKEIEIEVYEIVSEHTTSGSE